MTEEELIKRVSEIQTFKRGGKRAPHKPLLLLLALSKLIQGQELLSFEEIDEPMKELLLSFGPPSNPRPQYPFVRLKNDRIWELNKPSLIESINTSDPGRPFLIQNQIMGGFSKEVLGVLLQKPHIINNLIEMILDNSFPESLHEDILLAIGLDQRKVVGRRRPRDPKFREKILIAYEYQCAVCGFNLRLGHQPLALEAAHIKWHQAGGPDKEQNGFALCSLHHKLFDFGAFTINDKLELIVSEGVNGTVGKQEWLLNFHQKQIRRPQAKLYEPDFNFLQWHEQEVFKGYARR